VRYFKGYVSISDERDVPVLLHIRNARAISFRQLCELLLLEGVEKLGRVINWRVSRLKRHGLIQRFEQDRFRGQPVFAITPLGLPHRFEEAIKKITAAVCCIGCRHTHVGVSPIADGVNP
jgi:hypothetical protein